MLELIFPKCLVPGPQPLLDRRMALPFSRQGGVRADQGVGCGTRGQAPCGRQTTTPRHAIALDMSIAHRFLSTQRACMLHCSGQHILLRLSRSGCGPIIVLNVPGVLKVPRGMLPTSTTICRLLANSLAGRPPSRRPAHVAAPSRHPSGVRT